MTRLRKIRKMTLEFLERRNYSSNTAIVKFFQTGVPPVPNEETLEIFSFMDAALRSKQKGGAPMKLR